MEDLTLNVNEIFLSIQGEGERAGELSIFVRLQYCNLKCKFCDTEFNTGKQMRLKEIYQEIIKYKCNTIIFTGGEPALQLKEDHVQYFKNKEYYICIETNGTMKVPYNIDFISLSPKVSESVIYKNFNNRYVHDLKYIIGKKSKMPVPLLLTNVKNYYLQPENFENDLNNENTQKVVKMIYENKTDIKWKISIQLHKILKIK